MARDSNRGPSARGASTPEVACTCALVRRAARRITQTYDDALRDKGLRITQYALLAQLDRRPGLSVSALAAILAMDRTTLTRNLAPLRRRGLVVLNDGPDRRSKALEITARGQDLLRQARPLWRKTEQALRRDVGQDNIAELSRLLDRVARGPG